jgi:hypothetical protein
MNLTCMLELPPGKRWAYAAFYNVPQRWQFQPENKNRSGEERLGRSAIVILIQAGPLVY